jgi:hypothetical protein
MAAGAWQDAMVLPYAAYLRVYEPLSAFGTAEARAWLAYATSAGRPGRGCLATALASEQAQALRRVIEAAADRPGEESPHAYVRWSDGVPYICPWQTRLRTRLAFARLAGTAPVLARAAFPQGPPAPAGREAGGQGGTATPGAHILAVTWSIPFAWFAAFAAGERRLSLGVPAQPGGRGPATAAGTRALVYVTAMPLARERVTRAWNVLTRCAAWAAGRRGGVIAPPALGEVAELGRWLAGFHPGSLVELDYGGLVHLVDDSTLGADESVAEVAATVSALAAGEAQFAAAMYRRFTRRWRRLEALERAC